MSGNGPPEDIGAGELWALITTIPRPSKVIDFPRKDPITGKYIGQLRIWPLTQAEQMEAAAEAERVAKGLVKDAKAADANLGYDAVYHNAAAVEVIFRACRDVSDVNKRAFPSPKMIGKMLSTDEVGALARAYQKAQAELGPVITRLSKEEEDAWIGRLAQGGSVFPSYLLSWDALEALAISMAKRLAASSTDTSSPGSQPEEK